MIPLSMWSATLINGVMGFGMLIACLYATADYAAATTSATGWAFIDIFRSATGSVQGAAALVSGTSKPLVHAPNRKIADATALIDLGGIDCEYSVNQQSHGHRFAIAMGVFPGERIALFQLHRQAGPQDSNPVQRSIDHTGVSAASLAYQRRFCGSISGVLQCTACILLFGVPCSGLRHAPQTSHHTRRPNSLGPV